MDKPHMKRFTLLLLAVLSSTFLFSQTVVIKTKAYTSYFDTVYRQPIAVVYTLYNGGGPCNRAKFRFKNDTQYKTASDNDYLKSGYDKGHLANAEDFAYNCELDEQTFRYYNAVPQTANLNRGVWKQVETEIRGMSKLDTLKIICYSTNFVLKNKLYVPTYCYKLVYTKAKYVLGYEFTQDGKYRQVPESYFKDRLKFIK